MYESYAPIMSFFVAKNFADFPWPNTDDWETATGAFVRRLHEGIRCPDGMYFFVGLVYPPRCIDLRSKHKRQQFSVDWKDKVATAVFRGNSTGGGVTPETNQRLHLSLLSQQWESDPDKNDNNPVRGLRAVRWWWWWLGGGVLTRTCVWAD